MKIFNLGLRLALKKPENLFLGIASFFGLATVFLVPALTVPDEGAHFWYSYGMFSANRQIPLDLLTSAENSVKDIDDGTYISSIFQDRADMENDTVHFNFKKTMIDIPGSPGRPVSSLDLPHVPQGFGILFGKLVYPSVGVMVTLGRLANLAVYIASIYLIIKNVRFGKLAIAYLALFPMMIQQAGSLSYDVLNAVAIFAWLAFMINLFTQKTTLSKKQLLTMLLLATLLIVTKRSNIILLGFLPFLPIRLYGNTSFLSKTNKLRLRFKLSKQQKIIVIYSIAFLLAALVAWVASVYLQSRGITPLKFIIVLFNTFFRPEVNPQLDPIVTTGIVGNFGWLWYRLPEWLVFSHLGVFILVLLGEKSSFTTKRFAVISSVIFITSITVITMGMYFMWTLIPWVDGIDAKFIQGIQGRYFTPLLILAVPTFAYIKRYIKVMIDQKLLYKIAAFMSVFSLTIYLVLTYIFYYTPASGVKEILLK